MDVFVFVCARHTQQLDAVGQRVTAGLTSLYAQSLSLPMAAVLDIRFKDARLIVTRAADQRRPLINTHETGRHVVVFFGEAGAAEPRRIAELVDRGADPALAAQEAGNDGAYGCIVYDKLTGTVHLSGDIAGQRTLRYVRAEDGLVAVSSHDIGLMATGLVAPEMENGTAASIRSAGWSIGDASLIAGVSVCRAGQSVTLPRDAGRQVVIDSIPLGSVHGTEQSNDTPIDAMIASLERSLDGHGTVTAELSAGFDSRASLAALVALREPSRIECFSEGPEGSLDVIVSRIICSRLGLRFTHKVTPYPTAEDFVTNWTRSAASCNGNFDISILASRAGSETGMPGPVTVCGDGGEIYRNYFAAYRPFLSTPPKDATKRLAARLVDRSLTEEEQVETTQRIADRVTELRRGARDEGVVLDRFYRTERFGVWNQKLARETMGRGRTGPFYSRKAMRAGENSGPPGRLHRDLIARHLKQTMNLPINDEAAVAQYGPGWGNRTRLETATLAAKLRRRAARKFGGAPADLEDARMASITRLTARVIADDGARLLPAAAQFGRSAEAVEDRLEGEGRAIWCSLGALRFQRICHDVYRAAQAA